MAVKKCKMRTVRTRLRKRDFAELVEDLASFHWKSCPKGYMICDCRRAEQLRELVKLAERSHFPAHRRPSERRSPLRTTQGTI